MEVGGKAKTQRRLKINRGGESGVEAQPVFKELWMDGGQHHEALLKRQLLI